VKSDGTAAVLEVAAAEETSVPNKDNFLGFVNLAWLKLSPYLHPVFSLNFFETGHRINGSYPHIYLQKPIKIIKDQLLQLTWGPDA
jgi:hypothetical protein